MKKNVAILIALLAFVQVISAQVGIGTTNPDESSLLHIETNSKGILIPKLTTAERDAITNPANGLLIFNTDSDEFQFNSNTKASPIWVAFSLTPTSTSNPGQSIKYSNTDTSTDVNQNSAINLPVIGTEEWNDNSTLYNPDTSNHTIRINEAGRYRVQINASISVPNSGNSRRAPEMYLAVNGSQVGTYASTGYMRRSSLHNEASFHINEVIQVSAGDVISVETIRAANSGSVTLRSAGSTNIYIEKIL
ncbi:hypothetical protein [Pontimicrobium sp. IMCC45349]|uniref:hypothetical protein n=1 Tax=Pontimicrobium sp. IMCC45349 TaxID=3391574 RepID=UPI0039A0EC09